MTSSEDLNESKVTPHFHHGKNSISNGGVNCVTLTKKFDQLSSTDFFVPPGQLRVNTAC